MWVRARWPIIVTSSLHHDDEARRGSVENIKYEMENGSVDIIYLICRWTLKTHLRNDFCKTFQ